MTSKDANVKEEVEKLKKEQEKLDKKVENEVEVEIGKLVADDKNSIEIDIEPVNFGNKSSLSIEEKLTSELEIQAMTETEKLEKEQEELKKKAEADQKAKAEAERFEKEQEELITADVEISKVDATTGKELPGATLVIKDSTGKEIDKWVSTSETHKVKLNPGTYTLTETIAPEGYLLSKETVTFTVKADGTT